MSDLHAPRRLDAPAETASASFDLVVIGSGAAGLALALAAAGDPDRPALRVALIAKRALVSGSTPWAQGGIAAALGPDDSPARHVADTLAAGAGLCDEQAVAAIAEDGPRAIADLIAWKVAFDRDPDGGLSLGLEGGHQTHRIVHARGDATGAELSRALVAAARAHAGITVFERAHAIDLLTGDGRVGGVLIHKGDASDAFCALYAGAVALATGGLSNLYATSTNPPGCMGDGVAMALRAGAVARDLEFVQFHPTALWTGAGARGQAPLVSEAVRGEGAVLLDADGTRFMAEAHPLADLAPRDVVARAIFRRMTQTQAPHVWLDGRAFGDALWRARFPSIRSICLAHGIDPARDLFPVAPAAHYACGGVLADLRGRTTVAGLYACGETAYTGVHGANRLASNSLLEAVVFARRIAKDVRGRTHHPPTRLTRPSGPAGLVAPATIEPLRAAMSAGVGVVRDAAFLARAADMLVALAARPAPAVAPAAWDAANLLTAACGVVAAARLREETRGCHWRADFPETDDARWRAHIDVRMDEDGAITATRTAQPATFGEKS